MTPAQINFLLHCHYSPHSYPKGNFPAYVQAAETFLSQGMIVLKDTSPNGNIYCCTEKGTAHVKALCALPIPVAKMIWVDGLGHEFQPTVGVTIHV